MIKFQSRRKTGRKSTSGGLRNLRLEALEEKTLLAGDVQVVVSRGDLVITGDRADNQVEIVATANPGEYEVRGLERGGEDTTINGTGETITVDGVRDDIRIDMGGGDSQIGLMESAEGDLLAVPDDLVIRNRAGQLTIDTDNVQVRDDLRIRTRRGSDNIRLLETQVDDDVRIVTLGGDDDVSLDQVNVGSDTMIKLGAGVNELTVQDTEFGDDLNVTGGHAGDGDTFRIRDTNVGDRIDVSAHSGTDTGCLLNVESRSMHIHMGRGSDRFDLSNVTVSQRTRVSGDGGSDTFGESENTLNGQRVRKFEEFDDFVDCFDGVDPDPNTDPSPST